MRPINRAINVFAGALAATGAPADHPTLSVGTGAGAALTRHTSITLSVGAPVVENLNGEQSQPEVRVLASLSRSF